MVQTFGAQSLNQSFHGTSCVDLFGALARRSTLSYASPVHAIYRALVAIVFSVFGLVQIGPLSVGNNPFNLSPIMKIFSAAAALLYSL